LQSPSSKKGGFSNIGKQNYITNKMGFYRL